MGDNVEKLAEAAAQTANRRGRRAGREHGSPRSAPARLRASTKVSGGQLAPLSVADLARIHATSVEILATIGMAEAPEDIQALVCAAGGSIDSHNRLLFPADLVARALAGLRRDVTLCGQDPAHDMVLGDKRVYAGSGGAAPMVVDLDTDLYRPATLADLYQAARLVDALENVHFFSRSVVARDMLDTRSLDINTAFAALAGTSKHVMVAASEPEHVVEIAQMCHEIAGSAAAFRARPFLSLNINHAVPPLRFSSEACAVLAEAVRQGLPVHVNTFGQLGASSPVTIAGCVAQTMAETLAGLVVAWLIDPAVTAICGPRPMITDLRTGGMAGGAGEQAMLTAIAVQMTGFLELPNSTIAGASDSKISDAQSGYEKCLTVSMAAQSGANLITQACGMQAGLMGCSFESYVIDNEMLGAVLRALAPVEVSDATLSPAMIAEVVRGEGHYLGHPDTLARMQSDFLYPEIADRRGFEPWQAAGSPHIRAAARARAHEILDQHFPSHLSAETLDRLRAMFDIRLPACAMRPHPEAQ